MLTAKLMVTDVSGDQIRGAERDVTLLKDGERWTLELIESKLTEWTIELHNAGMRVVRITLPSPFIPRVLIPTLDGIVTIGAKTQS